MIHELIYTSTANAGIDLQTIVAESIERNRNRSVTGILAFNGSQFLQLIEGPEYQVQGIFDKIKTDSRHSNVITQSQVNTRSRTFGEWPMRYCAKTHITIEFPIEVTNPDIARSFARNVLISCYAN